MFISFIIVILLIFMYVAYCQGTKKTFKRLLSFLIPIILSSIALQVRNVLLSDKSIISYYIAGIGTLLFYIVLTPSIMKEKSDRYKKISKYSQIFACFLAILQVWGFCSFIFFFIDLVYTKPLNEIKPLIDFFTIPIKFLWLFPK